MADSYQCRICLGEEDNDENLIVPCKCRGSQRYVHRYCLDSWRNTDNLSPNFYRCNQCLFNYTLIDSGTSPALEKSRWADYYFALTWQVIAIVLFIGVIIAMISLLLYALESKFHRLQRWYGRKLTKFEYPLIVTVGFLWLLGLYVYLTLPSEVFSIWSIRAIPLFGLFTGMIGFSVLGVYLFVIRYWEELTSYNRTTIWPNRAQEIQVRDYKDDQELIINHSST